MEEEVSKHPIWAFLGQFSALRGSPSFVETAADPQVAWYSQRVFQFVTLVEQRLRQVPATLMSFQLLGQIQSSLASVVAELNNFSSNRNIGHLNNASNLVDTQCYPFLAQIPVVAPATSEESLGKLADDYRTQVQGILKALSDERSKLQADVDVLRGQLATLSQQSTELASLVATQKAEAQVTVQALQTTYSAKEQEFTKAFEAMQSTHVGTFSKLVEDFRSERDKEQKKTKAQTEELLSEIDGNRVKAKEIVGIIGNIGVTGNYQKTAKLEADTANVWRRITLGAFAVSVVVGTFALYSAHEVDIKLTAARILFAFLILGVTVYTGKESARHRTNSDSAKRVELELASLGPFIQSLDKADQDALRKELTEKYFGRETEPHIVDPAVKVTDIVDLLKTAIGALKK
jgi:hypothetical protein